MSKENHLYYKPTKEGMEKIEKLRAKVIELDDLIGELTTIRADHPEAENISDRLACGGGAAVSRSRSISITKLEECRQRAIEAIVRLHSDGAI